MKNRFLYPKNTVQFFMTQRMVEIPVHKDVRNKIKIKKGIDSYSTFLEKVADGQLMMVGEKL